MKLFEIDISLSSPKGLRVKTIRTESFGLWVNRYSEKDPLAGEIRDIRLVVKEGGQEVNYTFVSFMVKEALAQTTPVGGVV